MTQPDRAPSPLRRAAAAAALVALVVALLYLAISAIFSWYILLASVISLGVLVVAVWFILSRRGLARAIAAVVAAVALVTFISVVLATESLIVLTVGLGLAAVSIVAASYALSPISAEVDDNKRAPRAHHPVLLMNLRSGGGKAERFRLADLCRERGIEPVILNRRPPPRSSLSWRLSGKSSALPRGVSGRGRSSKCVPPNPWRSGSTARPESSSHRCDSSAGPAH